MDNITAEEAEDYSGVRDPNAFRSFQLAMAYCLTSSEDSSEGDYDPARECILADDNIDKSPELKTASEKLVAAAYLLQAMPEPSTPSGRKLRRKAQVLIEQTAV